MPTKAKHGGPRPNSGRKSIYSGKDRRPVSVSLTPDARRILKQTAARVGISSSNVVEALLRGHAEGLIAGSLPNVLQQRRVSVCSVRVSFLRSQTPDQVERRINAFRDNYKRDWADWVGLYKDRSCANPAVVAQFKRILGKWQAARPRKLAPLEDMGPNVLTMRDLTAQAEPLLREIQGFTLRDVPGINSSQKQALVGLWSLFRSHLSQRSGLGAVGITKGVMLLTAGDLGPALDRRVREELTLDEPTNAQRWIDTLSAIADDLTAFEQRHGLRLETLVEPQYRPVGIGRAYDMAAGPRATPQSGNATPAA